jgi:RHS repeat-associated protein
MAEYGGTPASVGTQYLVADHLGSTRLILDAQGNCAERIDYAPFGAQLTRSGQPCYTSSTSGLPLFTGQIRDGESAAGTDTGLDYFNARYFWATLGRFSSPDEPLIDQDAMDPQSWNLYGYVRNNPLVYNDPTGRCKKGNDGRYHDSDAGPCVAPGGSSILVTSDDDEPASESEYVRMFFNEMSRRRQASNQMIAVVAGGSAAVGATGGAIVYFSGATSGSGLTALGLNYSALGTASGAAYAAAQNANKFTVPLKHLANSAGRWAKFAQGVDPQQVIREALSSPNAQFLPNSESSSSFVVVTNLGRTIGSKGETSVKVVVDYTGNIWTAYPKK